MSVKGTIMEIQVKDIEVSDLNVRKTEILKDIDALAENISRYGLLQPVVVLQKGDKYDLSQRKIMEQ